MAAFTIWRDTFDHGWIMPFLTAGMFVWGGGPVVLPMLMTFLAPAWISPTIFLAGISFAEMMPGPVFNISCRLVAARLGSRGEAFWAFSWLSTPAGTGCRASRFAGQAGFQKPLFDALRCFKA